MARWSELATSAALINGQRVTETVYMFHLDVGESGRKQKVFMTYELMSPDFEFLRITSAVSMISVSDPEVVIRRVGQLQAGCVSFTPSATQGRPDDGIINLCTVIPLGALDLVDPKPFLLYLNIFAMTADNLEQELMPAGLPDMF
jgi:hypothetical protein